MWRASVFGQFSELVSNDYLTYIISGDRILCTQANVIIICNAAWGGFGEIPLRGVIYGSS